MSSELPEGGLYIKVSKEDLAGAPPGVLEFLLNLFKKGDKIGRQDRRTTETGLKTQQEQLSEPIKSLTDTIQKSVEQHPIRTTTYGVKGLEARQNGDLGTGLPIEEPLQKASEKTRQADDLGQLRAEVRAEVWAEIQAELSRQRAKREDESGEASALSFDCDVVMVDVQEAEHGQKQLPSGTETTNDSADRVSASPCLELARTPLPSTGRGNSQAPSMQLDSDKPQRKSSRKLPANEAPTSTESLEKEGPGTKSAELPPKQKDKESPSPEILAKELIGSGATERIRRHALAYNRDTPAFPKSWDEQGDWTKQTCEFLNLADEWNKKSEFSKLVALILRTHGVERIYIEARSILKLDKEAPDPRLPTYIIDQVNPHLREKRTPAAFRRWLTLARKLFRLIDYLPFMPFDGKGPATFRHYERLSNEGIQQLRNLLDNDLRAQGLAKIGRAFQDRILKRQGFLWEYISSEELSKLPDNTFLHLLTIRRSAQYDQLGGTWYQSHNDPESAKLNSVSKQCDLCEEEMCELFTLGQDLASKQPMLPARDTIAQHSNIAIGVYQAWASETSPSAFTSFQTTDYSPSAVRLTLVDSLASQPLLPTCNAPWEEQAHVPDTGPQLQLALRRRVPDTAQSITFAMNGDIDGLKYLFGLGLASPRDESDSRGFSLISWALYGGMHNYETVQFLLSQGAHVDDESYEHVWDYRLRGKCSDTEQQALHCITERRDRDWFEEQNFPLIHKIIFGLSPKPLVDELLDNPAAVSAMDAQGRTALDWATSRAQLDDMRLLIACGSNLNTMDVTGRTTVLHAVDSHNVQALRIVLEAGADPNPQMPKGLFRSSPVTAASFGGLAGMIKLLVQFGAKIDADNPEGRTALQAVAVTQNVECAAILLQYGADMNHVSSNGCTPLVTAITHNKHAVLKVFLSKYAGRPGGSQLLSVIAQHADSETMSILASSQSFDLNGDDLPAGRDTLLCRKDYNNMLAHAFENLVSVRLCNEWPPC